MNKTPITDPRDMTIAILFELLRKTETGQDLLTSGDGDHALERHIDQTESIIDRADWLSYGAIDALHTRFLAQQERVRRRKVKRQEALVRAVRRKLTREEFDAVRNALLDE